MSETKIYYHHYCYDCYCWYVSDKRHARCWSCNSENTINTFREKYRDSGNGVTSQ